MGVLVHLVARIKPDLVLHRGSLLGRILGGLISVVLMFGCHFLVDRGQWLFDMKCRKYLSDWSILI